MDAQLLYLDARSQTEILLEISVYYRLNLFRFFRELESNISSGAQAHQAKQRRVEFRHSQFAIYAAHENYAQDQGPRHHLEAVKANALAAAQDVLDESPGDGCGQWGRGVR